ncbi:MAG: hypothetical protein ACI959_002219, partial [Limisphaerales bacterium]
RTLINQYIGYAKKAKFNKDSSASDIQQQGFITFKLTLK